MGKNRKDVTLEEMLIERFTGENKLQEMLDSYKEIAVDLIEAHNICIHYTDTSEFSGTQQASIQTLWWVVEAIIKAGKENMKVVSGGLEELINEGFEVSTEVSIASSSSYVATELNTQYLATIDDVINQLNFPDANTCIIDVRSQNEYDAGTIPTSVLIPFEENLFSDGTFKPMQQISILYGKQGIDKDNTVIMYCKSSVRGAQTFLAMFNAGYENVKLYDGAYLEWSSDKALPIQMPDGAPVISNQQDNS